MDDMKKAKKIYDEIEIPESLSETVNAAIKKAGGDRNRNARIYVLRTTLKYVLSAAVLFLVIMAIGCNVSRTFAEELESVPGIGPIANVLTMRQYIKEVDNQFISVTIPEINVQGQNTKFTNEINDAISEECNAYADTALQYGEEYHKAFLDTGGTEDEWKEHDNKIVVNYKVLSNTKDHVSFAIDGTTSWTASLGETTYYNLDLKSGKYLTLKDVLGDNYVSVANDSISVQIEERKKDPSNEYFSADDGGFTTITDDTEFYIDDDGNAVIVFEKYEIAPGSMGRQTFTVVKPQ